MLVTLPFVLLLLDYWPLGRMRLEGTAAKDGRLPVSKLVREKAPLLALSVASSVVTYLAQQHGKAVGSLEEFPFGIRVANAMVAYVTYIAKMMWPRKLAVFYPHPGDSLAIWQVVGAGLLLVCISFLVIRAARSRPYLPAGWLWYLGTLVPVIGLIQVGMQRMSDRYTYVPLIGIFIIIAWGVPELVRVGQRESGRKGEPISPIPPFPHSPVLGVLAGIVIAALMVCAWFQVGRWHDSITLFQHALSVTTSNPVAHNNIGTALAAAGRSEEAMAHYVESLKINPRSADAHNNIGAALADQGAVDEAVEHYARALEIQPRHAGALNNLGVALARKGEAKEAVGHLSKALEIDPDYADAHTNLGNILASRGHFEEAAAHYSQALQVKPNNAEARFLLGVALMNLGEAEGAMREFQEAVRLEPDDHEAHYNLAVALEAVEKPGGTDYATQEYREAIRLNPDYFQAHHNLGIRLATLGRLDEAMVEYREVIRIKPDFSPARANLAIALYQKGSYAEAWEEVRLCRRYGGSLDAYFLRLLRDRMQEPKQ